MNPKPISFDLEILTRDDLEVIGEFMLKLVEARFARGATADGTPFKPYSPAYAARLIREGKDPSPDMQNTGAFSRAWRVFIEDKGASASVEVRPIGSSDQLRGWAYANRERPVSGFTKSETDEIMSLTLELMRARLKKRQKGGRNV